MSKDTTQSGRSDAKSKAIVGVFGTLIVAIITLSGTCYMKSAQDKELSVRLYTELMAKREEAESALRKDMFTSIIGSFLRGDTVSLESKVLNLELLSYNFHESLDLKPLFMHLDRTMRRRDTATGEPGDYLASLKHYRKRLIKAAREVKRKQIEVLTGGQGQKVHFSIPWDSTRINSSEDTAWYYHLASRCVCCADPDQPLPPAEHADSLNLLHYLYHFCLATDTTIPRRCEVVVCVPRDTMDELEVAVTIYVPEDSTWRSKCDSCAEHNDAEYDEDTSDVKPADEDSFDAFLDGDMDEPVDESTEPDLVDTDSESPDTIASDTLDCCVGSLPVEEFGEAFHVGEFDFPIIDNSRLSYGYRFALTLERIKKTDSNSATFDLVLSLFPGSRSGLKDKPYYEDLVRDLIRH